jgi:hypothetical protein
VIKSNIILLIILMLCPLFSCKKKNTSISAPITDFEKHYSITSKYENNISLLTIDIILDDMLHAYADGEKIGKPVNLEILPKNGWMANGRPKIPQGASKKLNELGESVVLEGRFQIIQKLKKGKIPGEALLHLQVCTNDVCDRPRTHLINLE